MEHEWNMNGMAYRLNIDELLTQTHGRWMNWNIDRIWLGYWLTIDQVWSEYYIMEWDIDQIWLEYWLSIDGLWMENEWNGMEYLEYCLIQSFNQTWLAGEIPNEIWFSSLFKCLAVDQPVCLPISPWIHLMIFPLSHIISPCIPTIPPFLLVFIMPPV